MCIRMSRFVVCLVCLTLLPLAGCGPATPPAAQTAPVPSVPSDAAEATTALAPTASDATAGTTPPITEASHPLTDLELAQGWLSLFDGDTLFGWTPATEANWH